MSEETIEKIETMVREAAGHRVEYWEDPKHLRLGWMCFDCKKMWSFGLVSDLKGMARGKWRSLFETRESRACITAVMSGCLLVEDERPE